MDSTLETIDIFMDLFTKYSVVDKLTYDLYRVSTKGKYGVFSIPENRLVIRVEYTFIVLGDTNTLLLQMGGMWNSYRIDTLD